MAALCQLDKNNLEYKPEASQLVKCWFVCGSALVPELCKAATPGAVAATCVTITPYPNFSQRLTYTKKENTHKPL